MTQKLCQFRCVRTLDNAFFRYYHVNQVGRRDIQHGIEYRHPGIEASSSHVEQFILIPLFKRRIFAELE